MLNPGATDEPFRKAEGISNKEAEILYFPITADSSLTAALQNTLLCSCGDSMRSLHIEPLLQKHQSRIWIRIPASAFGQVMHAVIANISEAELGPVVHTNEPSSHTRKAYAA